MHERPALARPLLGKECQLAPSGVGADERKAVGPLDHVHSQMRRREVGDAIAVGDPERHVVERGGLHPSQITRSADYGR